MTSHRECSREANLGKVLTNFANVKVTGQYKMQTADCRLQTGYKMQTRYKMQTADCRLGIKCRLRPEPSLVKYRIHFRDDLPRNRPYFCPISQQFVFFISIW